MAGITSLPKDVLIRITSFLELKDILTLASVNTFLERLVFANPEIWTSNLLFPAGDSSITDQFIRKFVPRITRSYNVRELRLVDLPLTWFGILCIFDQFAHSVDTIHLKISDATLSDLVRHLAIFAGNLVLLQRDNKIPITFRQYALDETTYNQNMAAENYFGQQSISGISKVLATLRLDDPPFERLSSLDVSSTDHNRTSFDHENEDHIRQLYLLVSFLAGRQLDYPSRKRPREHEDITTSIPTKQPRRHDNGNNLHTAHQPVQHTRSSYSTSY